MYCNSHFHDNGNEIGGHLNYREIEKKRKEKVDGLAHKLLLQRERINRSIQEELDKFTYQENKSDIKMGDELDANTTVACEVSILEETQSCDLAIENVSIYNKGLLADSVETTLSENCFTNIILSKKFISEFILSKSYIDIEEEIKREKLTLPKITQIQIKVQINKRLTQVSGKAGQVEKIFNVLKEYSRFYIFIEIFTLKIIEQGKLQVSSCPGSYKAFSELFCLFYSPRLIEYFRVVLFMKEATINTIRGIYSIYFGILEIQENSEEAWFFISSLLNSKQNEMSCYVVECFFSILGDLLFQVCRNPFFKLIDYTRKYYFDEMDNDPCKSRLVSIFSKYGFS